MRAAAHIENFTNAKTVVDHGNAVVTKALLCRSTFFFEQINMEHYSWDTPSKSRHSLRR